VITPAYALTATERVLPRLALDFTTASLDARVTVTRALNTATRVNSSGFVESINANLPRFDFDPITKVCKGLLIEESRINIQLQSEDFSTTWSATGISVSTNSTTAPDGNATADTLTASASPGNIVYLQPVGNGTTYTFSLFVKKLTSDTVQINFSNVAAGPVFTFSTESFNTVASWTTSFQKLDDGWYRITATRVSNTTFAGMQIRVANSGEAIYAWGAQIEAGAFATSYIPTVASTVTRNADVVSMTGTNFSDWYNATEGSVVIQYGGQSSFGRAFTFSDGTTTNQIWMEPAYTVRASAATQYTTAIPGITYPAKVSLVFKQNRFAAVANGGTVVSGTSGNVPVVDRVYIGSNATGASSFVNNTIAKFMYYPQALLNAEARAFSK
jgi:hypothetical protein